MAESGVQAPSDFGRPVSPIQTGGQIMPIIVLLVPQDYQTFRHPCPGRPPDPGLPVGPFDPGRPTWPPAVNGLGGGGGGLAAGL